MHRRVSRPARERGKASAGNGPLRLADALRAATRDLEVSQEVRAAALAGESLPERLPPASPARLTAARGTHALALGRHLVDRQGLKPEPCPGLSLMLALAQP